MVKNNKLNDKKTISKDKLSIIITIIIIIAIPILTVLLQQRNISNTETKSITLKEYNEIYNRRNYQVYEIEKYAKTLLDRTKDLKEQSKIVENLVKAMEFRRDIFNKQLQEFSYELQEVTNAYIDVNNPKQFHKIKNPIIKTIVEEINKSHLIINKIGLQYITEVDLQYILDKYSNYLTEDTKILYTIRNDEMKQSCFYTNKNMPDIDLAVKRLNYLIDNEKKFNKDSENYQNYLSYKDYYLSIIFGKNHRMFLDEKTHKYKEEIIKKYEKIAQENPYLKDKMNEYLKLLKKHDYKVDNVKEIEKFWEIIK